MKIIDIQTKQVSHKRRKVFKIAFSSAAYSRGVYVKIMTDEGIYGLGEASPSAMVTGETIDGVVTAVAYMKESLIGLDPNDIALIHQTMDKTLAGNTSAKAAIDIACYDIMGKVRGKSVHELLGAKTNTLTTDMTIGIDTTENMVKDALEWKEKGFRILKLKAGIDYKEDLEHFRAIRDAIGDEMDLRVDFNQGYTEEVAAMMLVKIKEFGISEAEQPLKDWNMEGMKRLKEGADIPVMMDESVKLPYHAEIACRHDMCDIINIKLMKCGGIYPALQICEIAKKYNKPCLIGCMSESKLGIAAGAAVFAANDVIHDADLDSFLSIADSTESVTGGFTIENDVITLSDKPGFGFDDYEF